MSSRAASFVDEVLAGDAKPADIHDFIAAWHAGDSPLDLHDFLGLTLQEFEAWVKDPSQLAAIISTHAAATSRTRFSS